MRQRCSHLWERGEGAVVSGSTRRAMDAAALLAHGAFIVGSLGAFIVGSLGGAAACTAARSAARSAARDGGGEGAHARAILVPVGKGRRRSEHMHAVLFGRTRSCNSRTFRCREGGNYGGNYGR